MKLVSLFLISSILFACQKQTNYESEVKIYQKGSDRSAVWMHVGYLPRQQDPERSKIFISKKGYTLRVEQSYSHDQISQYAEYLYQRYSDIKRYMIGEKQFKTYDGTYTIPFSPMDKELFLEYERTILTKVKPNIGKGFQANFKLLQSLYPKNVFSDDDQVMLQMVFPIATGGGANKPLSHVTSGLRVGEYRLAGNYFEERRTVYKGGESYIFAGFPAFWIKGGIGVHGPITYIENNSELFENIDESFGVLMPDGEFRENSTKKWQVLRAPRSHDCFRSMDSLTIRMLLPAQNIIPTSGEIWKDSQPLLEEVKLEVTEDFDYVQINDREYLVGVDYYWFKGSGTLTQKPDEASWKQQVYNQSDLENLLEFPYIIPKITQLELETSSNGSLNPRATTTALSRAPLNFEFEQ